MDHRYRAVQRRLLRDARQVIRRLQAGDREQETMSVLDRIDLFLCEGGDDACGTCFSSCLESETPKPAVAAS